MKAQQMTNRTGTRACRHQALRELLTGAAYAKLPSEHNSSDTLRADIGMREPFPARRRRGQIALFAIDPMAAQGPERTAK